MHTRLKDDIIPTWVEGEISLAGSLDRRMMKLLQSIEQSGSISQAAKQVGLSYKGAWQILEKANNFSPRTLITTATGGYMGGGTHLTKAGKALLQLFTQLDEQHQLFVQRLNQNLSKDSYAQLLLEPLSIKNSAANQLFGTVIVIQPGIDSAEIIVQLIGGERIAVSLSFAELDSLALSLGRPVLLLLDSRDISIVTDNDAGRFSARNALHASVIRVRQHGGDIEITLNLIGDDTLCVTIAKERSEAMELRPGITTQAVFNSSAVIIAAKS